MGRGFYIRPLEIRVNEEINFPRIDSLSIKHTDCERRVSTKRLRKSLVVSASRMLPFVMSNQAVLSVHSFKIGRNNPPASLVLAGCGKILWARENFDGLQMWRKQ